MAGFARFVWKDTLAKLIGNSEGPFLEGRAAIGPKTDSLSAESPVVSQERPI